MLPMIDPINAELLCPHCKGNYLHHDKVETFERGEDSPTGIHTTIVGNMTTTDTSLTGNPSPRRYGLLIHFRCEQCDAISTLSFAQHKGNTLVDFKYTISEDEKK